MNHALSARVAALRQRLGKLKVDALLVSLPADIRYLTGFVGDDSWAVVWADRGDVHVLSDFRFQEQIAREAPQVKAVMRKKSLSEELGKLLRRRKIQVLGLQRDHVTLAQKAAMARRLENTRLKAVDDGLLKQRAVKDAAEVDLIRQSLRIQEAAFGRLLGFVKPGQTEVELAAYLEYQMRQLGADGPSFPTIVAADANASLPHAIPGRGRVRKGGIVLVDWGSRLGGYCSDLTRVIGIGGMSAKMREVYRIVLEAQEAAIAAIAPGMSLKAIDAVARQIISKAGYRKQFGHSLGHGIGLAIHEQPTLSTRSEGVLQPGHIVTVEPGIYLPGIGGVRIEDDVLVTGTGGEVLSSLPKSLKSAII